MARGIRWHPESFGDHAVGHWVPFDTSFCLWFLCLIVCFLADGSPLRWSRWTWFSSPRGPPISPPKTQGAASHGLIAGGRGDAQHPFWPTDIFPEKVGAPTSAASFSSGPRCRGGAQPPPGPLTSLRGRHGPECHAASSPASPSSGGSRAVTAQHSTVRNRLDETEDRHGRERPGQYRGRPAGAPLPAESPLWLFSRQSPFRGFWPHVPISITAFSFCLELPLLPDARTVLSL